MFQTAQSVLLLFMLNNATQTRGNKMAKYYISENGSKTLSFATYAKAVEFAKKWATKTLIIRVWEVAKFDNICSGTYGG